MRLALDDDDVSRIASAVADLVIERLSEQKSEGQWLNTREAAEHLGLSLHALRHLVARRAVPYVQDAPGSKVYFRASQLDAWREEQTHEVKP